MTWTQKTKKCHCPFESTIVLTLNLQLEKCMAHKE